MGKLGIMIASDNPQRIRVALSLALHTAELPEAERPDVLEVFFFAESTALLASAPDDVRQMMQDLRQRGILLEACTNLVKSYQVEDAARALDIALLMANQTFSRWAREGYAILSF
ncbi:DsrE family protein [Sulfobacillus thermosulfidooxidans]|uniref:DsrE family protein n=1 Tax=Sulfobacillus thermosulfidooxidans TaxID=28034 RepID=UPI00096BBBD0|nr:DsrE family protein [Sulfobacillus thermosulfidooxidans]OLZ09524.1 hypothetical protein BFX05_11165 [Sulfobacillus thermosulfidooxidans]OLZ16170.1 hypothetical protein BFX06_03875 [Sulfobacillus thermosulfidooxidans]OLZ17982.1 hypothetical protein BFX07_06255 [Sulfobacillus thermosulfidooxidans]